MKKIIILFVFFTYYSYSQQNGLLYYGYIESLPNGAAKGSDYNAYLIFNKEMSNYITAKDSLEKTDKIYEEKISYDEENNVSIVSGLKVSEEGDQVVYHIRKKTMWSNFLFKKQRAFILGFSGTGEAFITGLGVERALWFSVICSSVISFMVSSPLYLLFGTPVKDFRTFLLVLRNSYLKNSQDLFSIYIQ